MKTPKPNARHGKGLQSELPLHSGKLDGVRCFQAGRRCWGMSPRRSWSLADVVWSPEPGDEIVRFYPGNPGTLAKWICKSSGYWKLKLCRSARWRPDATQWRPALQAMGLWETMALLPEQQLELPRMQAARTTSR